MPKTALLLVDIQNDYFPGGRFELEGMEEASNNAAQAIATFRSRQMPIIHIRHENRRPGAGFFLPGSSGAEIHSSVAPIDGEEVICKTSPNSFQETNLEEELRERGVERLVIAGMMTLMCIDATSRAAKDLGFDVVVLGDACAARALEFDGIEIPAFQVHATFLAALRMYYADVVTTGTFLGTL